MPSRLVPQSLKASSRRLESPFTCIRAVIIVVAIATGVAGGTGDAACVAGASIQPHHNRGWFRVT
jgi:hypothetical protein